MVTHDPVAASYSGRVVFLADGALAGRLDRPDPNTVAERMVELTAGRPGPGRRANGRGDGWAA
jgi:putative ABC transport system ATP-binding protein